MQSHGQQVNLSFNDGDKHYLSVSGVGSIVRDRQFKPDRKWILECKRRVYGLLMHPFAFDITLFQALRSSVDGSQS